MNSAIQCPNDAHWLRFEGIEFADMKDDEGHMVTRKWFRWDTCDFCKTWYARRDNGDIAFATKAEPSKAAFRTEREGRS